MKRRHIDPPTDLEDTVMHDMIHRTVLGHPVLRDGDVYTDNRGCRRIHRIPKETYEDYYDPRDEM